ncbi:MAG: hypothetical protein IK125_05370 [Lachnospiraceae bacterium]|nr:hypothetical protein [Lachnospiraceae bacterium]
MKKRYGLLRKITSLMLIMALCFSCLTACGGDEDTLETTTVSHTAIGSSGSDTLACTGNLLVKGHANKIKIDYDSNTKKVKKVSFEDLYVNEISRSGHKLQTDAKTTYSGDYKIGSSITVSNCYIVLGGSKQYTTVTIKFESANKIVIDY